MAGEELHAKGADGVRRAKYWLEGTTRAKVPWTTPESANKLTFSWATGAEFSFDLRGYLRGEDLEGREFFAECKNYSGEGTFASPASCRPWEGPAPRTTTLQSRASSRR